ncbi:MAG TPA: chemotaxis protein CheW [Roseiflexaceae bacterium]|nr:chemotaxis protein CheW [Roseiflexaceae bacterium]
MLGTETTEGNELSLLLVSIADELYALDAGSVREVIRYRAATPVPGAPQALPGILSQRGAILPVVDLRLVLGFAAAEPDRATRLVILANADTELALLVDRVLDLATLPPDRPEPPPAALDPARARFIRSVARLQADLVILLDLDAVIAALHEWT